MMLILWLILAFVVGIAVGVCGLLALMMWWTAPPWWGNDE